MASARPPTTGAGGIADLAGRIARAAVRALIERQELGLGPGEFGGHINQIIVHGKVGEATLEAE